MTCHPPRPAVGRDVHHRRLNRAERDLACRWHVLGVGEAVGHLGADRARDLLGRRASTGWSPARTTATRRARSPGRYPTRRARDFRRGACAEALILDAGGRLDPVVVKDAHLRMLVLGSEIYLRGSAEVEIDRPPYRCRPHEPCRCRHSIRRAGSARHRRRRGWSPGPGQIAVDIRAAGVNPADAKFYSGAFGRGIPLPMRVGMEASGVVTAVGIDESAPAARLP